jgi:hypothetical protein
MLSALRFQPAADRRIGVAERRARYTRGRTQIELIWGIPDLPITDVEDLEGTVVFTRGAGVRRPTSV